MNVYTVNTLQALAKETRVPFTAIFEHYNHTLSFLERHTSCSGDEAVRYALCNTILEYK